MKFFPTDIFSLIEKGGYSFLKKNQKWPVNDKKFNKIIKDFHDRFFINSEKIESYTKNILYIDVGFLYFISNCVHFRVLEKILKKKKIKIKRGEYSKIFIQPNLKELSNPFFGNKRENKIKLWIKYLIKNSLKFKFFSKKKYLDIGGRSNLKHNFVQKNKISILESYPELVLNISHNVDKSKYFEELLSPVTDSLIKDIKKKFNINIDISDLLNIWTKRYSKIYNSLSIMLKKDTDYSGILLNDIYKPSSRLLGLYFKIKNKKAISFDHGNHANGRKDHRSLSYQLLTYNNFITISKGSKISLLETADNSIMRKTLKDFNIKYLQNNYLKNILKNQSYKKKGKKIKNIMIMGWPMNSRKYFDEGPCSFFYNKMIFEIELIKFLKKNNYNVFYKAHPERPEGINKIYGKIVDKIYFENFEKENNFEDIDTLIFTHTCSSTFGYSLCTNKKIILLYNENYFPDHFKLLKKRVKILPLKFDNKYKVNFAMLSNLLAKNSFKFNYDYVKKYLL